MRRAILAVALGAASSLALSDVAFAKTKPARATEQQLANEPAKPQAVLEVSVLHGTTQAKASDPRIGELPELREGPFAKYTSYQLLSRTELALLKGSEREPCLDVAWIVEHGSSAIFE